MVALCDHGVMCRFCTSGTVWNLGRMPNRPIALLEDYVASRRCARSPREVPSMRKLISRRPASLAVSVVHPDLLLLNGCGRISAVEITVMPSASVRCARFKRRRPHDVPTEQRPRPFGRCCHRSTRSSSFDFDGSSLSAAGSERAGSRSAADGNPARDLRVIGHPKGRRPQIARRPQHVGGQD